MLAMADAQGHSSAKAGPNALSQRAFFLRTYQRLETVPDSIQQD
jgi:hypothetical protein